MAGGEQSAPRGTLTLSAPVISGEMVLRPILDAFLDAYPTVSARLMLVDRAVNLIDEGVDVALRIGELADSSMVATRIGEVRRVVVAAPRYLKQNPRIEEPGDLAKHQIITMAHLPDSWSFPPLTGSSVAAQRSGHATAGDQQHPWGGGFRGRRAGRRAVFFVSGRRAGRNGELEIVLAGDEPAALPVHLVRRKAGSRCRKSAPSSILPCPGCEVISRGWPRTPAIAAPPFVRNAEECRSPDAYSLASRLNLSCSAVVARRLPATTGAQSCLHPPKAKPS